ncbi:MAG TPA: hypothetical protein VFH72_10330 [Candidatus Baltobacteraceae bacterium]|jgi:hypothetical protein|nr:hypothetical protein [Candidatus Baltobacteraceae bacterium]
MEFVSKQQTYEATRKLLLENAARLSDPNIEDVARNMQMDGDHSRMPALYQRFLDTITADPLEPQDALAAAAEFMEKNVDAQAKPQVADLIRVAKTTADDPEKGDTGLWNHWIELLASV